MIEFAGRAGMSRARNNGLCPLVQVVAPRRHSNENGEADDTLKHPSISPVSVAQQ
jgi:hypothetical protein